MESARPTVGVVMTMLELYRTAHPETPPILRDHWEGVLRDLLGDAADLRFTGVSHTAEEVARAVATCEGASCDLCLVLPLAYATSGAALEALTGTDLPLLLVSSARDATLPYEMTGDHIMANHAVHGVQDLANVLGRARRPFELLAGHPSQERFRQGLLRAVRAAEAARVFRKGRVGRIGDAFEGMLDFDPGPDLASFGMKIIAVDPRHLGVCAGKVTAERTADLVRWARAEFEVDAGLLGEDLEASARVSLALEDIVAAERLDAVTMNFLAVAKAGAETMPFLGASRLMAAGVGYAGEGDVLTAALVAASARLASEATFTEMFCPDYERSEVLLSHMGECNIALAAPPRPAGTKTCGTGCLQPVSSCAPVDEQPVPHHPTVRGAGEGTGGTRRRPVRLVSKPFAYGRCRPPAVPVFQLRPGPVTLACLTQWPGERFRLVVSTGEVVEAPEHANLSSPYTRLSLCRDLAPFLEAYSRAGGIHHLALAYGDMTDAFQALARFLRVGFTPV